MSFSTMWEVVPIPKESLTINNKTKDAEKPGLALWKNAGPWKAVGREERLIATC